MIMFTELDPGSNTIGSQNGKRRLTWPWLALVLLITLGLGAVVGILSSRSGALPRITRNVKQAIGLGGPTEELPGHWGVYQGAGEDPRLSPEQLEEVRRLRSLGYAGERSRRTRVQGSRPITPKPRRGPCVITPQATNPPLT